VQEVGVSGVVYRCIASKSHFESDLYGIPMWGLSLEIEDPAGTIAPHQLDGLSVQKHVSTVVSMTLASPGLSNGYLFGKVVKGEPLSESLLQLGFEKVEHRRMFRCQVRDLAFKGNGLPPDRFSILGLEGMPQGHLGRIRRQIKSLCEDAFRNTGFSRHFTDPVLLERLSGQEYISAVMELNFRHVPLEGFLLALDSWTQEVCGFTVVGRKPGLGRATYTQLLSAVRETHRGKGIYQALSQLLSQRLPRDATLLNVVQAANQAIQRAYQGSGREHLADTYVLRQCYGSD
jgi:GNAT superfamily N-acetyltransferase